jgi:hypothetical protein
MLASILKIKNVIECIPRWPKEYSWVWSCSSSSHSSTLESGGLLKLLLLSLPETTQTRTPLGLASSLTSLRHHRVLLLFLNLVILIASQLLRGNSRGLQLISTNDDAQRTAANSDELIVVLCVVVIEMVHLDHEILPEPRFHLSKSVSSWSNIGWVL